MSVDEQEKNLREKYDQILSELSVVALRHLKRGEPDLKENIFSVANACIGLSTGLLQSVGIPRHKADILITEMINANWAINENKLKASEEEEGEA